MKRPTPKQWQKFFLIEFGATMLLFAVNYFFLKSIPLLAVTALAFFLSYFSHLIFWVCPVCGRTLPDPCDPRIDCCPYCGYWL